MALNFLKGESASTLKAWRYMSLGRFVWLLKRKALWMSRVDRLEDAWEGLFTPEELEAVVENARLDPERVGEEIQLLMCRTGRWKANGPRFIAIIAGAHWAI